MRFIAIFLSGYLLNCAFALPPFNIQDLIFEPKEIKLDGSADWPRVVGGSPASKGQFPYMASLRFRNIHFCGATIISSWYLLSAAHCTVGEVPSSITAVVGTITLDSEGTSYVLSSILNHPGFNIDGTVGNDISILKTANSIVESNIVAPIPISSTGLGAGVTVTLSGWGRTSTTESIPNHLQFINLRTINNTECAERHSPRPIFDTNLCTFTQSGQGACFGDSGGPLVADGVLVGIVSWGEPCAVGYPDVFTRVSSYFTWIQENTT